MDLCVGVVSGLVRNLQRRKRSVIGRTRDWRLAGAAPASALQPKLSSGWLRHRLICTPWLAVPLPSFAAETRLIAAKVREVSTAQKEQSKLWRGQTMIHPTAVVDPAAAVGEGVTIGPYCVVGPHVSLSDGVSLHAHVHVVGHTSVDEDTIVHSFASVGAVPQDRKYLGGPSVLAVGRGCIIHSYAHICGGTVAGGGATIIGDDCLIMSHCHVGHDAQLGKRVVLASSSSLAGHVRVGDDAQVSGHSCVHQRVNIGTGAFLGGASALTEDLIPHGLALGNRARLRSINLVGLKRQGAPAAERRALLRAFRYVFDLHAEAMHPPLELPRLSLLEERARLVRLPDFPRVAQMTSFILGQRGVGDCAHFSTRALCRPDSEGRAGL